MTISPDQGEPVEAQHQRQVGPEGHQVSVCEVREAPDAVQDREADRGDNHDAADHQSAHRILKDDDAKDEREGANHRNRDDQADGGLDKLSTEPRRRAQGRPP